MNQRIQTHRLDHTLVFEIAIKTGVKLRSREMGAHASPVQGGAKRLTSAHRRMKKPLAEFKPKAAKATHIATVGEFLAEVKATAGFRASTVTVYSQSLRQITAEICDIGGQPVLDEEGQPKRDRKKRIVYLSCRDHQSGGGWLGWRKWRRK